MTSIETTPLLNPASETRRQNQIIVSRPQLPDQICNMFSPMIRTPTHLGTSQITIPQAAAMQKFIDKFLWKLSDTVNDQIYAIQLDIGFVKKLAPFGLNYQTFLNLKSVRLSFENTNNALYQGALLVYYDPSPDKNYFRDTIGLKIRAEQATQFLTRTLIEPKNRNGVAFDVDVTIPFELFKYSGAGAINDYVRDYSFGSIKVMVLSQLETKSPTTSLNFRVVAEAVNFETAGNHFI